MNKFGIVLLFLASFVFANLDENVSVDDNNTSKQSAKFDNFFSDNVKKEQKEVKIPMH